MPVLRVGVKSDLPPLAEQLPDGSWQGFEIDIANEIAERWGASIEWVPLLNVERLEAVATGDVDFAIAQISVTPARSRIVDFSPPYYIDGVTIVSASAEPAATLGVLAGSSAIATVNTFLTPDRLLTFTSYQAGIAALTQNEIDGFAGSAAVLAGWQQNNQNYTLQLPLRSPTAIAIALPKGLENVTLRQFVSQQVAELRNTGWLSDQQDHWGLP